MDPFPYILEYDAPIAPATAPEPLACPHVRELEEAFLLRPRSRAEAFRLARPLAGALETRCLLIAPPSEGAEELAIAPEDLRRWAAEIEAQLRCPTALYAPEAPWPCGAKPHCKECPATLLLEREQQLAKLGERSESLASALKQAFPGLSPQAREMLHAWAHRSEPDNPHRPILQRTLATAFQHSKRWVQRTLSAAQHENPAIFRQLDKLRALRTRPSGAPARMQGARRNAEFGMRNSE